jgi:hypothetical protein
MLAWTVADSRKVDRQTSKTNKNAFFNLKTFKHSGEGTDSGNIYVNDKQGWAEYLFEACVL